MSIWSHVYGMVQGYVPENTTEKDIQKVIGIMRVWDDFVEKNIVTSQEWKEAFDKTKTPSPWEVKEAWNMLSVSVKAKTTGRRQS